MSDHTVLTERVMTKWVVECCLYPKRSSQSGKNAEVATFRIFPEGDRDRWIAQTNGSLPREVQEEAAVLLAHALSKALG